MTEKDSFSNVTTAEFGGSRSIDVDGAAWAWRERKISRETLGRLGVVCGTEYFGDAKQKLPCFKFPYEDGGWKARAFPGKHFTSKPGLDVTFWGLRDVLNGPLKRVYIVEGEFDRCALVEAGVSSDTVLAVPGATNGELGYVKAALAEGLWKVKTFVLCTDQDKPGLEMRYVLAHMLGIAKTEFIDWPEGIKDANECLCKDGVEELRSIVIDGALPWPAEGLFKLSELPEPPKLEVWRTGFEEWGTNVGMAPGTMSIVTGHPGHGKTQLWAQIWFQIVHAYNVVGCIATFETKARPHYRKILRQLYSRKLQYLMYDDEVAAADRWIEDRYRFIAHREEQPELEWLLGQAEVAVWRHGAKFVQIDPWNRLEHKKAARETDTEYIGRALRCMYTFANDMNCHVQVIAHPSKMEGFRRGHMPGLEDISGSKNWENMTDAGFVVHRPKLYDEDGKIQRYAEMHYLKCRFDELGFPSKYALEYDVDAGRYGVCALAKKAKPKKDAVKNNSRQVKDGDYDEPERT